MPPEVLFWPAQAQGVVHRDLKQANVKVTSREVVKLLDVGLGRREGEHGDDPDLTQQGEVMGTPGYMSPEQVRGQPVDRRSDIFAFGCLAYECSAARKAFGGESMTARISAILESEPDWSALPGDVPPAVRQALQRCLAKDPAARAQHASEIRLAPEPCWILRPPGNPRRHVSRRRRSTGDTTSLGSRPVSSGGRIRFETCVPRSRAPRS
jgi:serine/threonine protein kinase